MSKRTSDLLKELTSQDKTTLEGKDKYIEYFHWLQDVFSRLNESFRQRKEKVRNHTSSQMVLDDPMEIGIIQRFTELFMHTIEVLRMKYLCETETRLRIDPTDSCYPNYIEFRELEADIVRKEERLRELPQREVLKQSILDYLFKHQQSPTELLKQLGRREYFLLLTKYTQLGGLFLEYTPGDLKLLDDPANSKTRRYLYSWGSFDVLTNRPHVYILIFDQSVKSPLFTENKEAWDVFETAIRKGTNNTAPLKVIAFDLDDQHSDIFPKVVKRIDLGPIYGQYSQDDHLYTSILHEKFSQEDLVMRFTTEVIFSIGEKKSRGFLSSRELRQIFFVDQSNAEAMERNVSEVHKYMLATHNVVQYLHDNHKDRMEDLAMPPITFVPKSKGIHGT